MKLYEKNFSEISLFKNCHKILARFFSLAYFEDFFLKMDRIKLPLPFKTLGSLKNLEIIKVSKCKVKVKYPYRGFSFCIAFTQNKGYSFFSASNGYIHSTNVL